MRVELSPVDTLFVRDSRSFGVDEAHAVDSIFPPPPSVLFGVMRTAILTSGNYRLCKWNGGMTQGGEWPEWFGDSHSSGELRQTGPIPAVNSKPLFPMPLDIVIAGETSLTACPMNLLKNATGYSSTDTPYLIAYPESAGFQKQAQSFWMDDDFMMSYLEKTDLTPIDCRKSAYPEACLWDSEMRVNVGIDPGSRAGMEGVLFSLNHVRVNPRLRVSLLSRWSGPDHAFTSIAAKLNGEGGVINLGGERRTAVMTSREADFIPPAPELIDTNGSGKIYFKLYFATPAVFDGGWLPEKDNNGDLTLRTEFDSVNVRLLAAAVGKPQRLGGYDIKQQRERSIISFVPAGSVYYFETAAENAGAVKRLHGTAVGDEPFYRDQGYGLALTGRLELDQIVTAPFDSFPPMERADDFSQTLKNLAFKVRETIKKGVGSFLKT